MKLPKKIRVGGSIYDIQRKPSIQDRSEFGSTDVVRNIITIDEGLTRQQECLTFLHEVCHAIAYEFNAGVKINQEEAMVRAMECGLSSFAKDHQKLFIDMIKEMGN